MRVLITILIALAVLACKNGTQMPSQNMSEDIKTGAAIKNPKEIGTQDEKTNNNYSESSKILSFGTYINTNNFDADNGCNALRLDYTAPTSLCVDKEGIIISVTYRKNGPNTEVFFNDLLQNNSDKIVPFNTFDKDIPIAIIYPKSNNTLTLDWKGFSVNGDLATDYAILGKKNLEGNFKKQQ